MNETTQIELKKCVERCVRPIRAGYRRKDRMRIELLAHLMESLDAELNRGASEADALRQTLERFGETAAIRDELQQSVPWLERTLSIPLFGEKSRRQPNESALHYDFRMIGYAAVMFLVCLTLLLLIVSFVRGWHFRSPNAAPGLCLAVLLAVAGMPLFVLLNHLKRMAIVSSKSAVSLQSVAATIATVAAFVVFTIALYTLINFTAGIWFLSLTNPWLLATVAVVAVVQAEIQARKSLAEMRRFDEWGSLDLDAH